MTGAFITRFVFVVVFGGAFIYAWAAVALVVLLVFGSITAYYVLPVLWHRHQLKRRNARDLRGVWAAARPA